MSVTRSLEYPGIKRLIDAVGSKPTAKAKNATKKNNGASADNVSRAMLAADVAVAQSIISGRSITTGEVLLRSFLPHKKSTQRRKKI